MRSPATKIPHSDIAGAARVVAFVAGAIGLEGLLAHGGQKLTEGCYPADWNAENCISTAPTGNSDVADRPRPVNQDAKLEKDPPVITVGSVTREDAARKFYFLQENITGRRKAINELTHKDPDFVFWIYPDGRLFDARDAHIRNYPKGHKWILDDEPDYGGFLRGRVATGINGQIVVVYCRPETLAYHRDRIGQLLDGISQLPVPLAEDALVISDNGDIYGTVKDLELRMMELPHQIEADKDAPPNGGSTDTPPASAKETDL